MNTVNGAYPSDELMSLLSGDPIGMIAELSMKNDEEEIVRLCSVYLEQCSDGIRQMVVTSLHRGLAILQKVLKTQEREGEEKDKKELDGTMKAEEVAPPTFMRIIPPEIKVTIAMNGYFVDAGCGSCWLCPTMEDVQNKIMQIFAPEGESIPPIGNMDKGKTEKEEILRDAIVKLLQEFNIVDANADLLQYLKEGKSFEDISCLLRGNVDELLSTNCYASNKEGVMNMPPIAPPVAPEEE